MTEEVPGVEERLPILRDLDGYFYVRHLGGGLVVGAFEPKGKPQGAGRRPDDGFVEFGEDWDHFAPVLEAARQRLPVLEDIGFQHYLARPGELHARRELPPGRVPRGARAVRCGGAQLAGDHLWPGRREGARGVDRRGSPDDGPHRGGHRAHGPLAEQPRVAPREDARDARAALRDALAVAAAR